MKGAGVDNCPEGKGLQVRPQQPAGDNSNSNSGQAPTGAAAPVGPEARPRRASLRHLAFRSAATYLTDCPDVANASAEVSPDRAGTATNVTGISMVESATVSA